MEVITSHGFIWNCFPRYYLQWNCLRCLQRLWRKPQRRKLLTSSASTSFKNSIKSVFLWHSKKLGPFLLILGNKKHFPFIFYLARDSFDPVKNSPGGSMIVRSTFFRDIFELHTKPFEPCKYFLFMVLSWSSNYMLCSHSDPLISCHCFHFLSFGFYDWKASSINFKFLHIMHTSACLPKTFSKRSNLNFSPRDLSQQGRYTIFSKAFASPRALQHCQHYFPEQTLAVKCR